ncbi:uracil-DNA glycosylase [Paenibacillus gansuensis]|uniref:Uracil-DNA glycosylase n=1 Tax=Paenibacillus gansuensis TaxID=306542 RepID=A0ABW5PKU4_9BACL
MIYSPCDGLPEEVVPAEAAACHMCKEAGLHSRMIWGEGNSEAAVYFILDNPGARESREGDPVVCGTRQTLLQGLADTGIPADQVYVTYLLKRRPLRAYDKPAARKLCMQHLHAQVQAGQPKLLCALGNVVLQSLLANEEAEVKQLRGQWLEFSGIPMNTAYHPLAVRRRPVLYNKFIEDLRLLAEQARNRGIW